MPLKYFSPKDDSPKDDCEEKFNDPGPTSDVQTTIEKEKAL